METLTVDYTAELFADLMASMVDYWQTGWTVCGAEDPAVISISEDFAQKHPEYKGFTVVRVLDRYVSAWKSDTLLEFSTLEITDAEYSLYNEIVEE